LGSDGLSDSESSDGSSVTGECTSVSLGEGRGGSSSLGVDSWRVGCIGLTRGERVVGVASKLATVHTQHGKDSLSRHDPLTTHLVKSVLTFKGSRVGAVLGGADSDTELVGSHVADHQHHPCHKY
jgi:hypothetical protein